MHSESSITQLLRAKYAAPEWAFLAQVKNRTGYGGKERYMDGLAMGLYPSRGMELHGFEIKVSRGDWLHELKQPDKAEQTVKFCNRFWVVVPQDDDLPIVRPAELPVTWGLQVVKNGKLRVITDAPALTPSPLDRTFIASILRNMDEQWVPAGELAARVEVRVREEKERWEKRDQAALAYVKEELVTLQKLHQDFEQRSGLRLCEFTWRNLADAVQLVRDGRKVETLLEVKRDRLVSATREREQLQREIAALEKAQGACDSACNPAACQL